MLCFNDFWITLVFDQFVWKKYHSNRMSASCRDLQIIIISEFSKLYVSDYEWVLRNTVIGHATLYICILISLLFKDLVTCICIGTVINYITIYREYSKQKSNNSKSKDNL